MWPGLSEAGDATGHKGNAAGYLRLMRGLARRRRRCYAPDGLRRWRGDDFSRHEGRIEFTDSSSATQSIWG